MSNTKKDSSTKECKEAIEHCQQFASQNHSKEEILPFFQKIIKEVTPANVVEILSISQEGNQLIVENYDGEIHFDLTYEDQSCILESFKNRQILLVDDVSRSFLYRQEIDNFNNLELKALLLFPLFHTKQSSKQKATLNLLYAATTRGNFYQFTQEDLECLRSLKPTIKALLSSTKVGIDTSLKNELEECRSDYENLQRRYKKDHLYFSSIIHDIRAIMNPMLGYLELLLLKNSEEAESREYVQSAIQSGEMMVALINDALDLSKISSGKMDIEPTLFSPFEKFADLAELFYSAAMKKGISFYTYFDPKLPKEIRSDSHRIKQVINNFLSNALKFTPKGGSIYLEILYEPLEDALSVSVRDTGVGISKDRLSAIFSAYTQESGKTSEEYGGTGLGLSIAQQLVVLLGGKIGVESEKGKGSRFFFRIPCHTQNKQSAFDWSEIKQSNPQILLYESDDEESSLLHRYLEAFEVDFHTFSNIEELSLSLQPPKKMLLILPHELLHAHLETFQHLLKQNITLLIISKPLHKELNLPSDKAIVLNAPFLPTKLYAAFLEGLISKEHKSKKAQTEHKNVENLRSQNIHALVVDDNPINLKFMRKILKTLHIESETAMNGLEALKLLKSSKIEIVFMDGNMPEMSGYEAIKKIRECEQEEDKIPLLIIGLSGDATKKSRQRFLSAGANIVLSKPVHLADLSASLQQFLGKSN